MVVNAKSSNTRCSYMSSDMIHTWGWRSSTSQSARTSARVYPAPVGFDGELKMNHFVRGVIAASSCAGVSLNALSRPQTTSTGVPPASSTMSG